ncbi:GTP cyclohydrolase II [Planktothrix sp. FACHB-1355]|uniref:GTP cyclohydrolase II n=1 Tax=Aerosakkonema funiforme FACHB-1375 TaxID=2949571 RepID=A0A926V990_9CYAN|nr:MULTISPECIES: GTP cyclohydrolase II [Oscillatoriales]MBD2179537.1 GTP cyclohydrolase II [Aerosakkonema funiforme FACHB-1375]MBD3561226.1 GTP cyclohydrolase II [Planktothrix sp. FACHB-1355]
MDNQKPVSKHKHIVLTSHPHRSAQKPAIHWGKSDPIERGPIIGTLTNANQRNAIGTHSGSYAVYRALAIASGALQANHRPDLTNTSPVVRIGPHPSWADPDRIISLDPFGAIVGEVYTQFYEQGYDIRPTIAVTKAHINMPELLDEVAKGELQIDGKILKSNGNLVVTKVAIDPVWYLPGIAQRLQVKESDLRRILFQQTGGMFPELVTRPDLHVFLPPIGGITVYVIGDVEAITDPNRLLAVRIHDECNGSDVFGSDICTCRPYLVHGIEVCIQTAQSGGAGVIVYFRKEGRALGEVTKFLVYNARKRQEGGDRADAYFARTECVAGVQDMRFQELMPDVLHWLGITRIDRLVSMSDMKYNAIVNSGIQIVERIAIPEDRIPDDAKVEIAAKQAAGYFTPGEVPDAIALAGIKGRGLEE